MCQDDEPFISEGLRISAKYDNDGELSVQEKILWSPVLHAVAEGNVKLFKFLSKQGVFWNISLRQSTYLDEATFKPDYDLDIPQALLITASSKKQ